MIRRLFFTDNDNDNSKDSPARNGDQSTDQKDSDPGPTTPNKPITPKSFERLPGSLYVVTESTDAAPQQACVFLTCEAFVRPAAARYAFELVVVRTDDEDEDPSTPTNNSGTASAQSAESQPARSDYTFPIDKSARFFNEDRQFTFLDLSAVKYILDVDDEPSATQLRQAISVVLFQKLHSALPGSGDKDELDKLLSSTDEPTSDDLLATKGELIRCNSSLSRFDAESNQFVPILAPVIVTINSAVVKEDNSRAYLMVVYHPQTGSLVIEVEISHSISSQFFTSERRLVWFTSLDPDVDVSDAFEKNDPSLLLAMALKFEDDEEFVRFRNQYSLCLYEVSNNASIEELKVKDEEIEYIQDSLRDDADPMDVDDATEEDKAEEQALERRQIQDVRGRRASLAEPGDGLINSELAVASNHDRTFVVRGNKIGIFQTGEEGLDWRSTIDFRNPTDGNSFTPSKVLLHRMDQSMLLLDPANESKIMRMDLERGEVVDTWDGGLTKNTPVKNLHQTSKYSNMTDAQDFIGLNKNQILRMDPRSKDFFVQSKKYASGTRARLQTLATTGAGYLATASENGDIRLFDQIGKNAKTHLPGLGDPIIGIDVTEDGHFILATTKTYLLLIDTRVKGQEKGGFEKSMGKNKPIPRKLTIKNEDIVKHGMGPIRFTTAHFNTGSSLERSIVTSTGPFIVIWNFRQVKMGRLGSYKIKRYQDTIIADNFTYNNDGRIVVTLPNDVSLAKR